MHDLALEGQACLEGRAGGGCRLRLKPRVENMVGDVDFQVQDRSSVFSCLACSRLSDTKIGFIDAEIRFMSDFINLTPSLS
jgi:hypothetical protein